MSVYTDHINVSVESDTVFQFVSDINNLSRYLPTVKGAHSGPSEQVELEGTSNGKDYTSSGWFKVDPSANTMTWGSSSENNYSGKLVVTGEGSFSRVECSLQFTPVGDVKAAMEKNQGGPSAAMADGLRASLASIKQICEGTGEKQLSSAE